MRILVQLSYPGHLRMVGATLAELGARGHEVLLSYDDETSRRDPTATGYEQAPGVTSVGALPQSRRTRRRSAIGDLRLATDVLRFGHSDFTDAPVLRARMEKYYPARLAVLRHAHRVGVEPLVVRALVGLERLIPADRNVRQRIAQLAPQAIVVSPLITRGRNGVQQTETVKAARSLGIPVGMLVSSWDHLSSKGLVKVIPDRVFVWNDAQVDEAERFHRVPRSRVIATGAQPFDRWFDRDPSVSRDAFLIGHGLDPTKRCVVYVGSSPNITPPDLEVPFVHAWLRALRACGDPRLAGANVVVRPHPGTMSAWAGIDLDPLCPAAVVPRERPFMPMSEADESLYFDTIHHADAVVGINTSAMLEAFAQGKCVLTVRADSFSATQAGTLHYRLLLPEAGGALLEATSLDEHVRQLSATLADPSAHRDDIERFVRAFLRPRGIGVPATRVLADAIEGLAALQG